MAELRRRDVQKFIFYLLPDFSMLSLCSAIEPLRIANRVAGQKIYEWLFCGHNTAGLSSSIGISVPVLDIMPEANRDDIILVCGGLNIEKVASKDVLNWLRKSARKGAAIGGLCTGTYVLARAGLLQDKRATIHWENQDSLSEVFPNIEVTQTPSEIDGNRYSTAGGVASIDLVLSLIEERCGAELTNDVAEQLIYNSLRQVQSGTTISTEFRKGLRHPKLKTVVRTMDDNLEEPLTAGELADMVHISVRQLERLFLRYIGESPKRYYLTLRLNKSRNLLCQTDLSVINVGLSCGFSSPSHFSKCYRAKFGVSPYEMRREVYPS